ncbi:MAG: creatininase family protein [Desulfurococcales archaeon]|nr:creatininase family protein [Desulfurococcales archaeon]
MLPLDYILLSSRQARQAALDGYIPIVPFGSMEQHCEGPLGTDSIIVEALARKACVRARSRGVPCLLLPTVYYGFSPEWAGVHGTVSLGIEAFTRLVHGILDSLLRTGFRRILVLNGHGGNSGLLYSAVVEWTSRHEDTIVALADYWRVAGFDIGHASSVEERLLSDAGVEADMGDCPPIRIGGPARIVNPPREPVKAEPRHGDKPSVSLDSAAESLASLLEELARLEPGKHSI